MRSEPGFVLSLGLHYFSVTVIKYPNKSHLGEKGFTLAHSFRGDIIYHGGKDAIACGKVMGSREGAGSRTGVLKLKGPPSVTHSSDEAPPPKGSITFPNNGTKWGQVFKHVSVQGPLTLETQCLVMLSSHFLYPSHLSLLECEMEASVFLLPVPCDPEGTRVCATFSIHVAMHIKPWNLVLGSTVNSDAETNEPHFHVSAPTKHLVHARNHLNILTLLSHLILSLPRSR